MEKENFRLRRLGDRFAKMEEEKKKLERIILQLSEDRNEELFVLISTAHDLSQEVQTLKEQNKKYHKILKTNKLLE